MHYQRIPCNTMQYHAIPCNTMQYHAIPCSNMQYPASPWNTMQIHAIPCNTKQCHAIPCNTMQYHAIPCNIIHYHAIACNTIQYHACLITADGAYHCPVGSIWLFFIHSPLQGRIFLHWDGWFHGNSDPQRDNQFACSSRGLQGILYSNFVSVFCKLLYRRMDNFAVLNFFRRLFSRPLPNLTPQGWLWEKQN